MTGQEFNNLVNDYGWVVAILLVVVAFFTMIGKAWGSIVKFVKVVDILIDLPEKLQSIEDKLHNVEHEVMTNSGTSIKDAVKRIEDRLSKEA